MESPIMLSIFETPEGKGEVFDLPNGRPFDEVEFVIEGAVTFKTPKGDITAEAGDSVCLKAGCKFNYVNSGNGKAVVIYAAVPPIE